MSVTGVTAANLLSTWERAVRVNFERRHQDLTIRENARVAITILRRLRGRLA